MSTNHPSGLSEEQIASLRTQAADAAKNAYAPYSHFRVGASVLLEDGSIFTGCNVENASYRLTNCAEETAIGNAINTAGPAIRLRAVAIANLNDAASSPCGGCRQLLLEFGSPTTWVFFPDVDGPADSSLIGLVPYGFKLDQE